MIKHQPVRVPDSVAGGDPELNVRSFVRHLRAANLAPTTIEVCGDATRQLTTFLGSTRGLTGGLSG
ncbi:MAG: hypothetical protein AB7G21_14930 [Dehalococcoidia bacterium]